MRAAAILGLGCSPKNLKDFQFGKIRFAEKIEWRMGMPSSGDEADVILVFGGDGTIHRHLGQLVRLGLPVLVVPAGSGNDFARAIGLRRIRDSVAAWENFCAGSGNVRATDLGVISGIDIADEAPSIAASSSIQNQSEPHDPSHNSVPSTRYFCCVAGLGLDGEVARRANQLPRWLRRHGGYALTLIPSIFRFAPQPMKIFKAAQNADQDSINWFGLSNRPTILAAFANTPFYGGGMKIAPQAKMDDGLLDICVVGGVDPFKLFCMFPTIYSGRHLKVREVEYFQAGRVRVETEHPVDVFADGEFVCRTPVEVGIEPRALRIVML